MRSTFLTIFFSLFLSFGLTVLASEKDVQCFQSGECRYSLHLSNVDANDEHECLDHCKENSECKWFTFYPDSSTCQLLGSCDVFDTTECDNCVSGQKECQSPEPTCWVQGQCVGNISHIVEQVLTKESCHQICQKVPGCRWFTHFPFKSTCNLMVSCVSVDETCSGCISGEARCKEDSDEKYWHMIIGGYNEVHTLETLKSVELYNWKTGEQCALGDLPVPIRGHVGTVLNGEPHICGGAEDIYSEIDEKACYRLDKNELQWKSIPDMIAPILWAGSVNILSQGWFIFGGNGNELEKAQKYVNDEWELGPDLIGKKPTQYQCVTQIDEKRTAFLGGSGKHNITVLDWTTMTYSEPVSGLFGVRARSSCATLKDKNGKPLVVVLGGGGDNTNGMEIWNVEEGVINFFETIPPDDNSKSQGIQDAQIVPINGDSEFLLYGGAVAGHDHSDDIWKYTLDTDVWEKVGKMLVPREEHVVLPVTEFKCP